MDKAPQCHVGHTRWLATRYKDYGGARVRRTCPVAPWGVGASFASRLLGAWGFTRDEVYIGRLDGAPLGAIVLNT